MPSDLPPETSWVVLPGKTLAEIEIAAIRSSFLRQNGNRRKMRAELGISKSNLLRKMDQLGLRKRQVIQWRLTEAMLSTAFERHCSTIAVELNIKASTLTKWINARAPFQVEEK